MLETLWKAVEALINTHFRARLQMNYFLQKVQVRKRDGDVYNRVKDFPGSCQNRPRPPLPGIPGPQEGLWHRVPGTTSHHTGRVWSGPLYVWTLGDLLVMSTGDAKT